MPAPAPTPPGLLDAALRADPARPLLTFYDDATDERTELSVATFANWVAKTANLLRDDLGVEPGATLALDLPCHWQAAVWLQAGWTLGLHVRPPGGPVDVHVQSYDGRVPAGAGEVVALGLGPWGLPRREATAPDGATLDFDREVHGHGDRFVPTGGTAPDAPLLTPPGDRPLAAAELVALARAQRVDEGARLLVTEPLAGLPAVLAGLLVPLAAGSTAVLCRNLDPARLGARAAEEGLVGLVGDVGLDTPGLPRWVPEPVGAPRNLA